MTRTSTLRPCAPLRGVGRFVNLAQGVSSGEVGVRRFSMVLVALLMAGGPAVADKVDPAVMAMLREWSLTSPSPSRVVICHGFGCAFRTEVALTAGDHAQMAAIMASGSASAQAERAAIGRTEAWFERRIAPITGTAMRVARAGPLIGLAGNRGQFDCIDTTNNTNSLLPFSTNSNCCGTIRLPRRCRGFYSPRARTTPP